MRCIARESTAPHSDDKWPLTGSLGTGGAGAAAWRIFATDEKD
jgi:hypothetical protein